MIALSVFAVVNLSTLKSSIRKLETKVLVIIAFTAIVTGFLPNLLYYFILQKSTSYLIATLIYSSPIFTLIASFFLLKEKITLYGFAGILSIIIGVVLLALNEIYIH
jgi:drug/metabolite transporter (DMT)-like permease